MTDPVGVKVHDVLNVAPKSYLIEKAVQKKEQIYLSHKREPLGKQYSRGHTLPSELVENGFGRPTPQDISGDLSKRLLHPEERIIPEEEKRLKVVNARKKIKKQQANLRHNFEGKPTKRTRRLSADKMLAPGDAKVAKKLLGIHDAAAAQAPALFFEPAEAGPDAAAPEAVLPAGAVPVTAPMQATLFALDVAEGKVYWTTRYYGLGQRHVHVYIQ